MLTSGPGSPEFIQHPLEPLIDRIVDEADFRHRSLLDDPLVLPDHTVVGFGVPPEDFQELAAENDGERNSFSAVAAVIGNGRKHILIEGGAVAEPAGDEALPTVNHISVAISGPQQGSYNQVAVRSWEVPIIGQEISPKPLLHRIGLLLISWLDVERRDGQRVLQVEIEEAARRSLPLRKFNRDQLCILIQAITPLEHNDDVAEIERLASPE